MNIALCGLGKAGKSFVEYAAVNKKHSLKAVICREESNSAGKTVTEVTNVVTDEDLTVQKISEFSNKENIDVIIDFSNSETSLQLVDLCCKYNLKLVICPTAFTDEQIEIIKNKANKYNMGVVFAPTLTVGINMLIDFVAKFSALFNDFSFEIIEKHSKVKASPTKTAQIIANSILKESVPISSIRLDGFVGVHEVVATNGMECITITHESFSRTAFVHGAILAAEYIYNKTGCFEMADIFKEMITEIYNEM